MNERDLGLPGDFKNGDRPPVHPEQHRPEPVHTKPEKQQEAAEETSSPAQEDETTQRAEALDPDVRRSMELGPPVFVPTTATITPQHQSITTPEMTTEPRARATLEEMLPTLVRKIAWGGTGQRGSVRMELGAGKLAGGTVVVHADDGKVRVEVSAPGGADPAEWRRRIDARLREHGLDVESVEVT